MNPMGDQKTISTNGVALCEVKNVWHEFTLANGQPHLVLQDISLAIQENEIVALLGPTGCGKSTLLRILAGLIPPSRGNVFYRGQPLCGLNPGVALVFQSFALYPWMTVAENIETVLIAAGLPRQEIRDRAGRVIRLVGLAGFEEAFPRELSGGMKQRVGMARALSVDPETLFMDEPFSQVDALTAQSLRAEVIDIWAAKDRNPSAILMVSHDIPEVVYMADRIVVLGANPGCIQTILANNLPRPRDYRSSQFLSLVDHLHEIITHHELPDYPPMPTTPATMIPLPEASSSEIVGLLEYLDARGGKEDLFRIVNDTNREFGRVINIVEAAELLDFVDTPKRTVVLDTAGKRFVKANAEDRQSIWREQILKMRLFRQVYDALQRQPDHSVNRDFVQETIVLNMPQEDYEKIFQTFVRWARFGNLFAYDETTGEISLQ